MDARDITGINTNQYDFSDYMAAIEAQRGWTRAFTIGLIREISFRGALTGNLMQLEGNHDVTLRQAIGRMFAYAVRQSIWSQVWEDILNDHWEYRDLGAADVTNTSSDSSLTSGGDEDHPPLYITMHDGSLAYEAQEDLLSGGAVPQADDSDEEDIMVPLDAGHWHDGRIPRRLADEN